VPSAQFIGYSSRKGAKGAKLAKGRGRPHAEDAEARRKRGRAFGRKFFPGISKFGVFCPFFGKKREKFDIFSDNFC